MDKWKWIAIMWLMEAITGSIIPAVCLIRRCATEESLRELPVSCTAQDNNIHELIIIYVCVYKRLNRQFN